MEDDKNITTVRLSEKALEIKKKLAPVFGMRNIVSAGLILLDRLPAAQQKTVIAEANGIEFVKPLSGDENLDLDEEIRAFARSCAVLTEKLERRASAIAAKKTRRRSG